MDQYLRGISSRFQQLAGVDIPVNFSVDAYMNDIASSMEKITGEVTPANNNLDGYLLRIMNATIALAVGTGARAQTIEAEVDPTLVGVWQQLSSFGLLSPVVYLGTGGNSNLSISSDGIVFITTALGANVEQVLMGTATGADGVVIPFTLTLSTEPVIPPINDPNIVYAGAFIIYAGSNLVYGE